MPINGLVVMTPTSIASTGTGNSSSINADGSVDFSSCATLSLNGVFTSSYDNYMVVVRHVHDTGDSNTLYRLRASGTDNSTASSYVSQNLAASSTTVSASRSTQGYGFVGTASNDKRDGVTLYLFGPYLAQPTAVRTVTANGYLDAQIGDFASTHNQSTAYDGITLYPSSGSFSGLLAVFGFNQ